MLLLCIPTEPSEVMLVLGLGLMANIFGLGLWFESQVSGLDKTGLVNTNCVCCDINITAVIEMLPLPSFPLPAANH
jgi:hypothetical protein